MCDGRIPDDCPSDNDDGFKSGERYLALNWRITDVLENKVDIPWNLFFMLTACWPKRMQMNIPINFAFG